MADTATASLASIVNGGGYELVPGVPVFDEHDEFDNAGNLVRRFDRAALEEIAAMCNRREAETGDLSPFGPGHTIDGAPEIQQPPIWGYSRNYRVAPFGPQGKLAILCDWLAKKAVHYNGKLVRGIEAMADFPRRSIELWVKDKVIDWIALLRRTPQRDLGLLTYGRDLGRLEVLVADPLWYDALKKKHLAGHLSAAGKLRYAMDTPMSAPHAAPPGVDPNFYQMFMSCMNSYFGEGGGPGGGGGAPERHAAPGFPGGGNANPPSYPPPPGHNPINGAAAVQPHAIPPPGTPGAPSSMTPPPMPPAGSIVTPVQQPPNMEPERLRLQREAEQIRFSRMEQQVAQLALAKERAECETLIRGLMYEGCEFDPGAEIDTMIRMNHVERQNRVNYIRRYHRKDPAGGPSFIQLAPDLATRPRETTKEERDAAVSYASKHSCSYEEALAKTKV